MNMFILVGALAGLDPYGLALLTASTVGLAVWGCAAAWIARRLESPVLSATLLGAAPAFAFCPADPRALPIAALLGLPGALCGAALARAFRR